VGRRESRGDFIGQVGGARWDNSVRAEDSPIRFSTFDNRFKDSNLGFSRWLARIANRTSTAFSLLVTSDISNYC
jgi:hypothetical protein